MTRLWLWAPMLAQMAAIFVASSMTGVPDLPGGLSDHTGHFIGYAILGVLALRGFARARWDGVTTRAAAYAVGLSSAYGITDEFHQRFVTGRQASVGDWVADTLGAAAGVLAVWWLARRIQRRRTSGRGV
jgi:VanZ family protein